MNVFIRWQNYKFKIFMFRKLCILLIFSKLKVFNHLIYNYRIHNLYAIFAKFLDICKQMAGDLVNEHGDMPRWELSPGSQTWKSSHRI